MALVVKDRVQETTTTTGTGTITLAGAVTGFQSFSVIGDANTTYYAIVLGSEWEVGLGTYTSSGTTLSRDTILESSNGGTAVDFSAGTKNVFVTYPAERALYTDASSNAIALGTPASVTLTNGAGLPISTGVSGLGTNVATALAVNVGSSGALVTNGGALGTPSSGTLTNCTFPTLNQDTSGSAASLSATLVATSGGTGQSSYAVGDLLFASTTTALSKLADVATGNAVISGGVGVAPSYGKIGLTTHVSGTLPVANGGTGQTTYTNGELLIGNTTGNTLAKATLTGTTNQVVVTNGAGTITLSTPQSIGTASSVQFGSFGVGTAASGTTGEIRATNNVTAFYSSDKRLKENIKDINNALDIVCSIGSKTFDWTDEYIKEHGGEDSYFVQKSDFGVIAQDVQTVFPQAVRTRDDGTLAVDYEKLSTLAFGAIKELVKRIEILETK
jgi:hypothetical protein